MRVLVTGSSGFIGQYVTREIASRGWEAVPFDQPDCDVTRFGDLERALARRDLGAVINLAGVLGTAEIIGSERRAAEVNIGGTLNLLDAAKRYGGIPVVQIGTGHKGQPNPYAITKACAEDLCLARAQWTGQKIAVARAYHVYGPGQKPPPPHGTSPVRKIIPSFACRALTGMPLEVWGSGEQRIDLVHAEDVAKVLVDAAGGPWGQVTEAGTGKPVTVTMAAMNVLGAAERILGGEWRGGHIRHLPMRPGEPEDATVVAQAPACPNPWPHRLEETIRWYQAWLAR